jgi:two-component system OmpR family sensor kinase
LLQLHGIKRRWLTNNLGFVLVILLIAVFVISTTVYLSYYNNMTGQLSARADATATLFKSNIKTSAKAFYDEAKLFTQDFINRDIMEFEAISLEGKVLFSSMSEVLTGFRPGTPDVAEAINGQKTVSYVGNDSMTGERVISVTAPVFLTSGDLVGAVRYVSGLSAVSRSITSLILVTVTCAAVIFLFVLFSNYYFIRSIVNPIKEINEATKQIAAGEYGSKIEKKFDDEIGELADSINFMSGEIERSITIKNDFISSVSHELRTPLTAISGWAETLLQSVENIGDLEKRGLTVIAGETSRLREMVEELLDFSRIESGRLVINKTTFDIVAELEDTIFMFEQRLAQDGLHVVYTDNIGEEAYVSGDRSRLRQVFVNIIDNARKYSKSGDTIDITIAKSETPGHVEIRFADHGTGIAPEDLPHVKEKFYKGNQSRPGSGIGLAVSDEIIMLHKGKLSLDSELGVGTTVTVLLPLTKRSV